MKLKFVLITLFICAIGFAQTKGTVSGTLLDKESKNQPLPFANVLIKGTTIGVNTDIDGKYSINLAAGNYLAGGTDGMADKIPATIAGKQPAKLSHGEFVIPADVVSHLGNGNSEAGATRLYDMMDKIRTARTGTKKQGKQINPNKYLMA